jgi:two-component system copper resistance phosphate regulon response regulator CusR
MSVLLVEDEPAARWILEKGLREQGYDVVAAATGREALDRALLSRFDLIVLDLMLPGVDGLEVCRRLRTCGVTAPILMVTARDAVSDRIAGLDAGGDDYLVKPYDFGEFLARARALLRRGPLLHADAIGVGDLLVRPRTGEAHCAGVRVPLTPKEFGVLEYLTRRAGEVVSQQDILDHAWNGLEPDSNVVEVYVARLRRKLEATPSRVRLYTRRGHGYVLDDGTAGGPEA